MTPENVVNTQPSVIIGRHLRVLRAIYDLSAEDVARACGLSKFQLSHIESGRRMPSARRYALLMGTIGRLGAERFLAPTGPRP